MFLALREIATARGRFALIGGVVGLITLLLVMLSGLTQGLSKQNTSALEALAQKTPNVTFSTADPSFTESEIHDADVPAGALPLGTSQTKMSGAGGVAVLGLPAGTPIPGSSTRIPEGGMVLSQSLHSDRVAAELGGQELAIRGVVPDLHYSHSPVVWVSTQTWQAVTHAPADVVGTAVLSAEPTASSVPMNKALTGLPAYSSERGSLLTMQAFLYGISALVTIAFLSIWTIQRTRDLSILRALGASVRYLLRDALSQAAIILAAGVGLGALVGWGLGLAAQSAVPFEVSAMTVLVPALGIWVLGILGAFIATRRVASVNPLDALGGNA
ncbi:ABC transporter permease [Corynebacterium sp.]|uniref:ABC transporter permease n=1 Tax=Corynebacterium sp. TaxID=1720 RepID=UPI0026DBFFFB|nr:ABC transporter permease [Corynebacterium sp.]MDO5032618.1 ABC transporter permease [Corynebacterium sp.]